MLLSPRGLRDVTANLLRLTVTGRVADLRPMPADLVDGGPDRAVHRYRPPEGVIPAGPPVLLIPPPGVPGRCFDLRRGCSLAEHIVRAGRLSYLLEHRRDRGLQDCAGAVLPGAVRAVSRDAGGQPVQLVGWGLGGILALLAAAGDPPPPIASVAVIATPVDARAAAVATPPFPLFGPPRGAEGELLCLLFGGTRGTRVKRIDPAAGVDKYMLRPYRILTHLDNADFLAHAEAVDHFASLLARRPGPGAREIQRAVLRHNALIRRRLLLGGRRVDLGRVGVPVLAVAGRADPVAPVRAVRPLARLLAGSPQVRIETAPGGHLGVLTGRAARSTTWRHLDRWLDEGIIRHGIRPQRAAVIG